MLTQSFGAETSDNDSDTLTAVEFDPNGDYLATGDQGGRIVLFTRTLGQPGGHRSRSAKRDGNGRPVEDKRPAPAQHWKPYFQFQSHEPAFDYLKSLPIEERINQIQFCKSVKDSVLLLTTNYKTVKLWKVNHRAAHAPRAVDSLKKESKKRSGSGTALTPACLKLPSSMGGPPIPTASTRQTYQNAHLYHVNSLSLNSDGRTFISADDLRINWWDLEISDKSFNVIDMKPKVVEELSEVITAAKFHPQWCNALAFSTSKGAVRLADTRMTATCDHSAAQLMGFEEDPFASSSFFSEVIASISDLNFSPDGRYLLARDYLSIKVWDMAMSNKPVRSIPVNGYLRPALAELYESDCMFDKFRVSANHDATKLITGSYSNRFTIYNINGTKFKDLSLPGAAPFYKEKSAILGGSRMSKDSSNNAPSSSSRRGGGNGPNPNEMDVDDDCTTTNSTVSQAQNGQGQGPNGNKALSRRASGNSWSSSSSASSSGSASELDDDDDEADCDEDRDAAEEERLLAGASKKAARRPVDPTEDPAVARNTIDLGSYVVRSDQKVLHYAWHPHENTVAVAGRVGLYIYRL